MWFLSKMGADTIRMLITENNYSHYYLNTVYSTLHFSVYCHDFLPESPASTERGWGRVSQQDSRSHPLHCVIFFVCLFGFCLWCLFVCLFIICFSEENLSPVFGAAYLLAMWLLGSCLTTLCFTFSLWKKKNETVTPPAFLRLCSEREEILEAKCLEKCSAGAYHCGCLSPSSSSVREWRLKWVSALLLFPQDPSRQAVCYSTECKSALFRKNIVNLKHSVCICWSSLPTDRICARRTIRQWFNSNQTRKLPVWA